MQNFEKQIIAGEKKKIITRIKKKNWEKNPKQIKTDNRRALQAVQVLASLHKVDI